MLQESGRKQGSLLDTSELSLDDLDGLDPSALVLAIKEILDRSRHDDAPVAGFTSSHE